MSDDTTTTTTGDHAAIGDTAAPITDTTAIAAGGVAERDRCHYPGCVRARRPDPATGRPSRYCGRADEVGGPVHNRATAWKARRAQHTTATAAAAGARPGIGEQDGMAVAPVSMARATLEQRLAELPDRLAGLRAYLDEVVAGVRTAGDLEAAGAEVQDAHRDALAKVAEAQQRAEAAERAARAAQACAQAAEHDRAEADALVEDALGEAARAQQHAQDQIAAIRAEADTALDAARQQLAAAAAETERAHHDAEAARLHAATAQAAQHAAEEAASRERQTTAQLRADLERQRHDAHTERQALRKEHAEQLAATRQDAQQQIHALTEALTIAKHAHWPPTDQP